VSIRERPDAVKRRFVVIRWLVTGSVILAGVTNVIARAMLSQNTSPAQDSIRTMRLVVPLMLVATAACCLHFVMDSAARALSDRKKLEDRNTWWAYAIFWGAALVMVVWLNLKVTPEMFRVPRGREATLSTTGQS
jgi:hypothetical protein